MDPHYILPSDESSDEEYENILISIYYHDQPPNEDNRIGFKAFNTIGIADKDPDLTTEWGDQSKIYKVGGTYKFDGEISMNKAGYHYCSQVDHCYYYYPSDCVICMISVDGEWMNKGINYVTNKFTIVQLVKGSFEGKNRYSFKNGQRQCL